MNYAKKSRIENWEYENQLRLVKTVEVSQEVSVHVLKWISVILSFLLYIVYGIGKLIVISLKCFFVGPQLIMHVSPEKTPLERYEFEKINHLVPPRF